LVLAFNNSATKRNPLSIAVSKDNGKTWPIIKDVETDNFEFSYPSLAQAADGKVWLTYTWKRKSIGYAVFDRDWLMTK
jgi:predicted neuraminidase